MLYLKRLQRPGSACNPNRRSDAARSCSSRAAPLAQGSVQQGFNDQFKDDGSTHDSKSIVD
jgi:hypothetical protein